MWQNLWRNTLHNGFPLKLAQVLSEVEWPLDAITVAVVFIYFETSQDTDQETLFSDVYL